MLKPQKIRAVLLLDYKLSRGASIMKQGFGTLNWIVLVAYLIIMLLIGLSFSKKSSKNSDAFFKAKNSKVPAWAVGFSMFATTLSAITYMSTPEKSFLTDWAYAVGTFAIVLIAPLIIHFYIPFFSKLKVTTAYEYLEFRFNPFLRIFSSLLFILFHVGRIAIVIYLPTVALQSIININPYVIAILITALCIIYTDHGGMEGVIWSDVIQGILLLVGAVLIIGFGIKYTHGGFGTVMNDMANHGKFITKSDWGFSLVKSTIPIIFIGQIFNNLYQYTASQDIVQRYTTTTDKKSIAKSIWTNAGLAMLTIPGFYGMGTVLYSFYNHGGNLPGGFNTSAIVPYFVLTEIPAGIAGLIIAAIFAASQATIASSLNSTAACVVTDFQKRFMKDKSDAMSMKLTHLSIYIVGLFSLMVTLVLISLHSSDMIDTYLSLFGLFGVPIAGTFALGIFSKRANGFGATLGLIATSIFCYVIQTNGINALVVSAIGFMGSMILGYMFSFLKQDSKDITGLTIYTINQRVVETVPGTDNGNDEQEEAVEGVNAQKVAGATGGSIPNHFHEPHDLN